MGVRATPELRVLALNHYPGLVSVSAEPQVWINYAFNYFVAGGARYQLNGTDYRVGPGTAMLFRPGDTLQVFLDGPDGVDVYAVIFGYAAVQRGIRGSVYSDELISRIRLPVDVHISDLPCHTLRLESSIAHVLLSLFVPSESAAPESLDSYNEQLETLLSLYRQSVQTAQTAEGVQHEIRSRLERIIEDAALAPRHHPNNTELARSAGMSTPHFERVFRMVYGRSPQSHLTGMRMEAAKRLLITTEMTLGELAAELGYANSNVLSNTFLRECGSRPSVYRSYQRLA